MTFEQKLVTAKAESQRVREQVKALMDSDEFFDTYEQIATVVHKIQADLSCDADVFAIVALTHAAAAHFSGDVSTERFVSFVQRASAVAEKVMHLSEERHLESVTMPGAKA